MTVELAISESSVNGNKINLLTPLQSTTDSTKYQTSTNSSITSSPNSKSMDERSKSPLTVDQPSATTGNKKASSDKSLTINCVNIQATSSGPNSSASSTQLSPDAKNFQLGNSEDARKHMKRTRESSCDSDRPKSSNEYEDRKEEPALKSAKVSYSIMDILGSKEAPVKAKKAPVQMQGVGPDMANFIQQQLLAAASGGNGMGQFMMNQFLAAAAFSANGGQQPAQQMPWINMAAMSGLYGMDKGFSNGLNSSTAAPSGNEQNIKLPTYQQQQQRNSKFNFINSPNKVRTSSPTHDYTANNQLQQMVTSLLHQQHQTEADTKLKEPVKQRQENHALQHKLPHIISTNNLLIKSENSIPKASSDSSYPSSPLSVTPPLNQRYMLEHDQRHANHQLFNENNNNNRKLNHSFEDHSKQAQYLQEDTDNEENLDEDEDDMDEHGNDSFENGHRKKKTRTVFSRNQVFQLESTFDMKRYLSSSERSSLANSLQLTETQIKIWFQNRRNKWKRQLAAEIEANSNISGGVLSGNGSNPVMHHVSSNQHHLDSANRVAFSRASNIVQQASGSLQQNRLNHQFGRVSEAKQDNLRAHSFLNEADTQVNNHMASSGSSSSLSSSSTRSSLSSPSQNLQNNFNASAVLGNLAGHNGGHFGPNNAGLLTPQMLAAAAAASSMFYAATGTQPSNNPGFNLSQFAALNNGQGSSSQKQSLSGIL